MVPGNHLYRTPPRCNYGFMTLIKVRVCVRGRLRAREKLEDRGFLIELGANEFSGMRSPNHLTFKILLSNCHRLLFG